MYYADASVARKFDKMKEQFFKSKSNQYKKQQQKKYNFDKKPSLINSPFIKKTFIRIGILGIIYATYCISKPYFSIQYFLQKQYIDYVKFKALQALWLDFKLKFNNFWNNNQNKKNKYDKNYANEFFTSILQQDYQQMRLITNPRIIEENVLSKWGIGLFRYNTNQNYIKIDEKGDVISQQLTSYFKIGSINLFGRKKTEIIERAKPYIFYKNSIQNSSNKQEEKQLFNNCLTANYLNYYSLDKNECQHLLEYCRERSLLKWKQIKDLHKKRQKQKIKKQKNHVYIIC